MRKLLFYLVFTFFVVISLKVSQITLAENDNDYNILDGWSYDRVGNACTLKINNWHDILHDQTVIIPNAADFNLDQDITLKISKSVMQDAARRANDGVKNGILEMSNTSYQDGTIPKVVAIDTDWSHTFSGKNGLYSIALNNLDTTAVNDMQYMFHECRNLNAINLSGFDTSSVTNMSYMFNQCTDLEKLEFGENWNTVNVTDMKYMFSNL